MRGKKIIFISALLILSLSSSRFLTADEKKEPQAPGHTQDLSIQEFMDLAIQNDTEFEKILIDELALQYEKDLNLPARDLVLSVKAQYDFILDQDREEPEGSVGLSKLFPLSATNVEAEYATSPSYTSTENTTAFTFEISQPIAANAFGKATRLKDKIIGLENDVARHQIVEAYEDYLAAVINGYYNWYEAYENLKISESSYGQNIKLLENMKERQKNNIALPIDVNKVNLQVLAKKEKMISQREEYTKALNFITKAIRYDGDKELIPVVSTLYTDLDFNFEKDFQAFKEAGRTYQILALLEEQSTLEVDKEADDLLPSIDAVVGYNIKGRDLDIQNQDHMVYAGVSLEWPIGDQVDRAEYESSKINLKKTQLSNQGVHFQLYNDINNLSIAIQSVQELFAITEEKISLAQSVLEDETERYSFGKVTLNDYIDAVNVLDNNRFSHIFYEVQYKKDVIEWLRITDQLISEKDIEHQ